MDKNFDQYRELLPIISNRIPIQGACNICSILQYLINQPANYRIIFQWGPAGHFIDTIESKNTQVTRYLSINHASCTLYWADAKVPGFVISVIPCHSIVRMISIIKIDLY